VDAGDLINDFATGTYTVTRRAAATMVKGRAVPGATSTLTIAASVQPASGRDLLQLPEGRRSVETRVVFTATELLVGRQGAPNECDHILIDGQDWEVQQVQSWRLSPDTDAPYWRCIVQATV
jgi:hypothetical protein